MMARSSVRSAVTVLALFVVAPAALQGGDPNPIGGSLFGNRLDEQKIRDDFAKLRQQLEQPQEEMRRKNTGTRFHRWTRPGTKRSSRDSAGVQKNFGPLPEQHSSHAAQKSNSSISSSR
jgi:hypothetical protein